jgi:phospho-N-acetylmuramoyl-pentapeptide-transferase
MLYYLLRYLEEIFNYPGSGLYKYISFRATCAAVCSLLIAIFLSKKLIVLFSKRNIREEQRDLGIGHRRKKNTPTMGGIAIIFAIVLPTLLFAKLHNVYILLLLFATIWLGSMGFMDDYLKVRRNNKDGIAGKFKIAGQVVLGAVVSCTMFFHKDIVVRQQSIGHETISELDQEVVNADYDVKTTKTNIPFFKNNEFDYSKLVPSWMGDNFTWVIYILAIIFIVCAVSNAANLTDGMDGLAAGSSAIIGSTLLVFAYLSGNFIFANYLNIMYIPNIGEVSIFCTSFIGSCIGFLWYNAYPAQIFMGDTGSLTLGGLIAVIAVMIRKELLLPLLCGVFVIENLSVIVQVVYFKYTRIRFGVGKRIFACSPIHHHFHKKGMHEAKVVARFIIIGMLFAVLSLVTLKIR